VTRVAIIADDLTGALDTASPFACRGARTYCFTEPDAISVDTAPNAEIISVSTNSRHMPPELAAATVKAAARIIKALSPDIVLKKVDSRLNGNVAVECDVVATVFGQHNLLVVPAAPDIGRFVIDGAVQGAGVTPSIPVATVLANSVHHINCPDVPSQAIMQDIALSFLLKRDAMPVCSRGFAMALAACLFPDAVAENIVLAQPWLIAIGSRDPVTAAQRVALCDSAQFVCREAPDGMVERPVPLSQALLLHCSGAQRLDSETVARVFAQDVQRAMTKLQPGTLLCSGGDTARAVLQAFAENCLHVLGEAAPGLPVSRIKLDGRDVIFISKSGGFGKPSTLLDVFADQLGPIRPKATDSNGPQHKQYQH
jgi:D-threonate/D-erythronate kinase